MSAILLVDDRFIENDVLREILVEAGHDVVSEADPARVLSLVNSIPFDLVISDLSMTGQHGVELVQNLHRANPALPILIMTDSATIENAIVVLRQGAFDCLKKPFLKDEFLLAVDRVIRNSKLARENIGLREEIQRDKDTRSDNAAKDH
jgi:DNA-binding NtrC family response regulator